MLRLQATTEHPDVEEEEALEVAVAPPWMTVLHNCDCHTFEEVVKQLMKAIGCSEERGWELAWQVHNTGKAVVKVNQRKAPTLDGAFVSLGVFRFEKGKAGHVEVSNEGVDGHVILDAVQWLPVKE